MQQQTQIHIVEDSAPVQEDGEELPTATRASHYDGAEPIGSLRSVFDRDGARFVWAVADELGKDDLVRDARLVDEIDTDQTDDIDLGTLLAFPDESLLFVGSDPTARDSIPLFAFIVERFDPVPAPETAQDALDLLKPADVLDAIERDGEDLDRQGEWWLLPTTMVPVGTIFEPGVASRPFGPSPLGNHVPREYGFTVSDDQFMSGVRGAVDELPSTVATPPEVIDWVHRQHRKTPTPEFAPDWSEMREIAGEILVRGSLRHRENDHYLEDVGDEWHLARTHDFDVYTGDEMIDRVRID